MSVLTAFDLCHQLVLDDALRRRIVDYALEHDRVLLVTGTRAAEALALDIDEVRPLVVQVMDIHSGEAHYIFPEWVILQVSRESGRPANTFVEAVDILASETRVLGKTHLHEWLNLARPNEETCPGGPPGVGGPHQTVGLSPCWRHRQK